MSEKNNVISPSPTSCLYPPEKQNKTKNQQKNNPAYILVIKSANSALYFPGLIFRKTQVLFNSLFFK